MGADLRRLGFAAPELLRFEWLTDRAALLEVLGDGPHNTWNDAVIEFTAYRTSRSALGEMGFAASANLEWLLEAAAISRGRAPDDLVAVQPERRRAHDLIRHAYRSLLRGDREGALVLADEALGLVPADPVVQRSRGRMQRPSSGQR